MNTSCIKYNFGIAKHYRQILFCPFRRNLACAHPVGRLNYADFHGNGFALAQLLFREHLFPVSEPFLKRLRAHLHPLARIQLRRLAVRSFQPRPVCLGFRFDPLRLRVPARESERIPQSACPDFRTPISCAFEEIAVLFQDLLVDFFLLFFGADCVFVILLRKRFEHIESNLVFGKFF